MTGSEIPSHEELRQRLRMQIHGKQMQRFNKGRREADLSHLERKIEKETDLKPQVLRNLVDQALTSIKEKRVLPESIPKCFQKVPAEPLPPKKKTVLPPNISKDEADKMFLTEEDETGEGETTDPADLDTASVSSDLSN